jgi:sec-independent protein translocase protein TatA
MLPNVGPAELIIILAIALLVVGPKRLPEMGTAVGRTIREFRKATSDITDGARLEARPTTHGDEARSRPPASSPAAAGAPVPDAPAAPDTGAASVTRIDGAERI